VGQELTQVLCPECGTSGESAPEASRWQCAKCGNAFFLRRCASCARVSHVNGLQGFRMPWACALCGRFNAGFSQNQDPATASAAELAAEVGRYGSAGDARSPGDGGPGDGGPGDGGPGDGGPGDREPAAAAAGGAGAAAALAGLGAAARPGRRRARRIGLWVAVATACAAAATVLVAAEVPGASGLAAGQDGKTRAVHVTASGVGTIDFRGVPGRLSIVGARSGQVILTGQLDGDSHVPTVETRFDRAARTLVVSVRCAPGTKCTQNLRLAAPADTVTVVRQPGGQIVVTGLAGPLRITAANVDISASGLRSTDLDALITSGHLSATFAAPPRQVGITLARAQATIRLPTITAYRVTQEVTSGFVKVAIPEAGSATHTVTVRIDSGELELAPS
jgi:ribosomal protein S27AE